MKKFTILFLSLGMVLTTLAQHINVPKDKLTKSVQAEYIRPVKAPVLPIVQAPHVQNEAALAPNETKLGETFYDLQSNASISNRFWKYEDGTMAAVWTRGMEATSFPDRGTAYNYYDGAAWDDWPTERIQDIRCGWPSYAAWGADGEVSVAHNGVEGLEWSWRTPKGSGDWTQQNYLGPAGIENDITWPRMITTGTNNEIVHLFVNSYVEYEGQPRALLYSRTDDSGATWDPQHVILDGLGEDAYTEINADDYVLAARGDMVVLLVASPWQDLFFMKSEDNGENWEKTVIWEHPYPFFDFLTTITDTFFCCDGSANVAIGPDGKVHAAFGINRVYNAELSTTYNLFPYVDGIGYWNEDMDRFSNDLNALAPPDPYNIFPWITPAEMVEDENYIGWMQDIDGNGTVDLNSDIYFYQQIGPSNMPSIHVDEDNFVHVIFVSTTETYEFDVYNYKHLWYRTTHPMHGDGGEWGPFVQLTEDISHIFDESYYPVIADFDEITQTLHYIFNTDVTPGLAWSDDHAWQTNNIIYGAFPIPIGIDENVFDAPLPVSVNPNPVTSTATFSIGLEDATSVTLLLTDLNGQEVRKLNYGVQVSGESDLTLDLSDLPAGIYFYRVIAGKATASGKLVKQ